MSQQGPASQPHFVSKNREIGLSKILPARQSNHRQRKNWHREGVATTGWVALNHLAIPFIAQSGVNKSNSPDYFPRP
jgi:hypothetical protein